MNRIAKSNAVAKRALAALIAPLTLALTLAGCAPPPRDRVNKDKLDADIDRSIGGLGTCVILLDTQSGRKIYQYGKFDICSGLLPPCQTFEPVAALIGLDAGLITPQTVFKWDGAPQPTRAWQVDGNLSEAFQAANGWWFGHLSQQIGRERYGAALRAFDYGNKDPIGPITSFWMGPAQGGGLGVSPAEQAGFMRRLYAGKLRAKPESLRAVQALLANETRGQAQISAVAGSCSDQSDHARGVGWWTGRLKSPDRDLVFAAAVESAEPPPGSEVEVNLKAVFSDVGLWPDS
jgi:beta-lactamase class D